MVEVLQVKVDWHLKDWLVKSKIYTVFEIIMSFFCKSIPNIELNLFFFFIWHFTCVIYLKLELSSWQQISSSALKPKHCPQKNVKMYWDWKLIITILLPLSPHVFHCFCFSVPRPIIHPLSSPSNMFCVTSLDPDTLPSVATLLMDVMFYSGG